MLDVLSSSLRTGSLAECNNYVRSATQSERQQFSRIVRQASRAASTIEILRTDQGIDPVSGQEVQIYNSSVHLSYYDQELHATIEEAKRRGASVQCIDGCVWLGAFDVQPMTESKRAFVTHVLNVINNRPASDEHNSRITLSKQMQNGITELSQSVTLPNIRPIFLRAIDRQYLLDILRRTLVVYAYLDVDGLLDELRRKGLDVRWQTKRERADDPPAGCFAAYGRSPVIQRGTKKVVMGDIVFAKVLYEGWTVGSLAEWYNAMFACSPIIVPSH